MQEQSAAHLSDVNVNGRPLNRSLGAPSPSIVVKRSSLGKISALYALAETFGQRALDRADQLTRYISNRIADIAVKRGSAEHLIR